MSGADFEFVVVVVAFDFVVVTFASNRFFPGGCVLVLFCVAC